MARSKIYRNLEESTFKIELHNLTFVFSSEFNMSRFVKRTEEKIEKLENELKSRFGFPVNLKQYGAVITYTQIEKRGFLIISESGVCAEWQSNITLDGRMQITKN